MSALQRIKAVTSTRTAKSTALVVASAAISSAVTYKVASKRIEAIYAAKIDEELEATRRFYAAFQEKPSPAELVMEAGLEPVTDHGLVTALGLKEGEDYDVLPDPPEDPRPSLNAMGGKGALVKYNQMAGNYAEGNGPPIEVTMVVDPPTQNIFGSHESSDTIPQKDVDARDPEKPYVITQDEFMENSFHTQDTLTFYADDAVLADSQDQPIDDENQLVGPDALVSFGIGSGDSRVVYVRNEKISQDFEIILHDGNYDEIVQGIKKVDASPQPRKRKQQPQEE